MIRLGHLVVASSINIKGIPWKPFFPCISASRVQVAFPCISASRVQVALRSFSRSKSYNWKCAVCLGFRLPHLKAGLKVHTNRVLVYLVSSSTLRLLSIDAEDTIFSGHIVAATG
jgi:hypothetical protein